MIRRLLRAMKRWIKPACPDCTPGHACDDHRTSWRWLAACPDCTRLGRECPDCNDARQW